jgi:hypothetical protein
VHRRDAKHVGVRLQQKNNRADRRFVERKDPSLRAHNFDGQYCAAFAKRSQALQKIIAAAKLYDTLYLRQIWSGNEALLAKLQADKSALGQQRLHYFMINKGTVVAA